MGNHFSSQAASAFISCTWRILYCDACKAFFKGAFAEPSGDQKYPEQHRNETTHLRVEDLLKSRCSLCSLIKSSIIRTFHNYLTDKDDAFIIQFFKDHFLDGPISLSLDKPWDRFEETVISKVIIVNFPDARSDPNMRFLSQNVHLVIWAAERSPAGMSGLVSTCRRLQEDGSLESFDLIKSCLSACIENHPECRKTIAGVDIQDDMECLPTRVIDVSPFPESKDVKLVVTDKKPGVYVTLSHCWGPPEKKPLKTTKENLKDHIQRISFDTLPKTFKDAVEITRHLGIKYLWIDSLCIIQDDTSDWKTEAKTMGLLYERARCTIAAADSTDSTQGFFLGGRKSGEQMLGIPFIPDGKTAKGIFLVTLGAYQRSDLIMSPLQQRAWVYQERHLSRRTAYGTSSGLLWHCKSMRQEAAAWAMDERGFKSMLDLGIASIWQDNVTSYTMRKLTYESDRLTAIEGLATELAKTRTDQYYHGIWTNELPRTLLWIRISQTFEGASNDRLVDVPTWSWATIAGTKIFMEPVLLWAIRRLDKTVFAQLGTKYQTDLQLLAAVTAGSQCELNIHSYLKKASSEEKSLEIVTSDQQVGDFTVDGMPGKLVGPLLQAGVHDILDAEGSKIGRATFDVTFAKDFYCLFMCNSQPIEGHETEEQLKPWRSDWFQWVLILAATPEESTYERIGLGFVSSQTWYEGEKVQQIYLK